MKIQQLALVTMGAVIFLASNVFAAPVVNVVESPDNAPGVSQPVSPYDLVDESSPALLSESWSGHTSFSGSTPDVLNDGSPGGPPDGGWNLNANEGAVTTQKTPWTLTYMLDTSIAPQGYDISSIEAMSLWLNDYVNQHYSVAIATVGNPSFTSLIDDVTANEQVLGPNDAASSLKTVITDDTGVLATNVIGVQFLFETQPQTYAPLTGDTLAAYKEIDVYGTISVPEPAAGTLLLVACGLLALCRRGA